MIQSTFTYGNDLWMGQELFQVFQAGCVSTGDDVPRVDARRIVGLWLRIECFRMVEQVGRQVDDCCTGLAIGMVGVEVEKHGVQGTGS